MLNLKSTVLHLKVNKFDAKDLRNFTSWSEKTLMVSFQYLHLEFLLTLKCFFYSYVSIYVTKLLSYKEDTPGSKMFIIYAMTSTLSM